LTVKLNKKDVVQTTDDALTLFRAGIKSEETRRNIRKKTEGIPLWNTRELPGREQRS